MIPKINLSSACRVYSQKVDCNKTTCETAFQGKILTEKEREQAHRIAKSIEKLDKEEVKDLAEFFMTSNSKPEVFFKVGAVLQQVEDDEKAGIVWKIARSL